MENLIQKSPEGQKNEIEEISLEFASIPEFTKAVTESKGQKGIAIKKIREIISTNQNYNSRVKEVSERVEGGHSPTIFPLDFRIAKNIVELLNEELKKVKD